MQGMIVLVIERSKVLTSTGSELSYSKWYISGIKYVTSDRQEWADLVQFLILTLAYIYHSVPEIFSFAFVQDNAW